jgi:site-specific recombinase XerD
MKHDLRHTAATRMADAGADLFSLGATVGLSDIRMTTLYICYHSLYAACSYFWPRIDHLEIDRD